MGPDHVRAATANDLAEHHDIVEGGPNAVIRAAVGLVLGIAAGALSVLLTPRERARARERD